MRGTLFFCAALLIGTVSVPAAPSRPMEQAPGYFRYAVGDFVVTALLDGTVDLPMTGYQGLPAEQVNALIKRSYLQKTTGIQTAFTAYLVDTGVHRILVDAGNASCYGWKLDGVPTNLRAAGYTMDEIDIVVLTHLHGDHVCGLVTADGKRAFPKAQVWVADEEAKYWLNEQAASAPFVRPAFAAYGSDLHMFKEGATIVPGVRIVPTHGHTPGHTAYLFESRGASLLAWGDIVHAQAVQFPHPELSIGSDSHPAEAVATRSALLERLAKDGTLIAGSHLPFPGVGRIRKDGDGYVWIPVEFGPLPK